jgi:hypothetical protein
MSEGPRLSVFLTASPYEPAWTAALVAAATSAGWRIITGMPPDRIVPDDAPGILRLATCEVETTGLSGVTWLVIGDSPSAAVTAVLPADGKAITAASQLPAIWHTAQRFATASSLMADGARVLDATADVLDLPPLGTIRRANMVAPAAVETPALNIYRTLPPVSGVTADWSPALFTFPAGGPGDGPFQVDLTGRARILVYGPHIDLPQGDWRATVRVGVDPEGGRVRLRFEWGVGFAVTTASVAVQEAGRYAVRLDQNWAGSGPAEMRIWLDEASFGGRLTLVDVRVERL